VSASGLAYEDNSAGVGSMAIFDESLIQVILHKLADFDLIRRRAWEESGRPGRRVGDVDDNFEVLACAGRILVGEQLFSPFRFDAAVMDQQVDFCFGEVAISEFDG